MKKYILASLLLLAFVISPSAQAAVECHNFSSQLYYNQDGFWNNVIAWANRVGDTAESTKYNNSFKTSKADTASLHAILESEGYTIASAEKTAKNIKVTTAEALVKFQKAHNLPQVGFVEAETIKYLNQAFGCIEKATIDLTEPNSGVIKAVGETLPIKWIATKIPNETTLTISYVKANGTGTTTITTKTIKNGKGSYDWVIPNIVAGSYKVELQLTGVAKSDISAKTFEIRDKSIEIIAPTTVQNLKIGDKLTLKWKTSSTIKATDKIDITLSGTLVSNMTLPLTTSIGSVSNTGSYAWTVPGTLGNYPITGTSTFSLNLSALGNTYKASTTDLIKILPLISTITTTGPGAGSEYRLGQKVPIRWTSTNIKNTDYVDVYLVTGSGASALKHKINTVKNTGSLDWPVPEKVNNVTLATTTLNYYSIDVVSGASTTIYGRSPSFSITPIPAPTVKVLTPNTSDTKKGASFAITWENKNFNDTVKSISVDLVKIIPSGEMYASIKTGLAKTVTSTTFTLPTNVSGTVGSSYISGVGTDADARYKIMVRAVGSYGQSISFDYSDAAFSILKQ